MRQAFVGQDDGNRTNEEPTEAHHASEPNPGIQGALAAILPARDQFPQGKKAAHKETEPYRPKQLPVARVVVTPVAVALEKEHLRGLPGVERNANDWIG